MTGGELSAELAEVISDLIVDHPMWIDERGEPLDYTMRREAKIADFVTAASDAIAQIVAARVAAVDDERDEGALATERENGNLRVEVLKLIAARDMQRESARFHAERAGRLSALVEAVRAAAAMSDHEPTNKVWHEQMQRIRAALGGTGS